MGTGRSEVYPHGAIVRERRRALGMTQAVVAQAAELSEKRYQDIERGFNTSIRSLGQVALVLKCKLGDIVGEGPVPPLTPYDTNPAYRRLIDALEVLRDADRAEVIRHALWSAERLSPISQDVTIAKPNGRTYVEAPEPADDRVGPVVATPQRRTADARSDEGRGRSGRGQARSSKARRAG